jgi:hypothetical protein
MTIGVGAGCGCEQSDEFEQLEATQQRSATLNDVAASLESIINSINAGVEANVADELVLLGLQNGVNPGTEDLTVSFESIVEKAKSILVAIFKAAITFIKQAIQYLFGHGGLRGGLFQRVMEKWEGNKYTWSERRSSLDELGIEPEFLEKLLLHGPVGVTVMYPALMDFWNDSIDSINQAAENFKQQKPKSVNALRIILEEAEHTVNEQLLTDEEVAEAKISEKVYMPIIKSIEVAYDITGASVLDTDYGNIKSMSQASSFARKAYALIRRFSPNHKLKIDVGMINKNRKILVELTAGINQVFQKANVYQDVVSGIEKSLNDLERKINTDKINDKTLKQAREIINDFQGLASILTGWFGLCLVGGDQLQKLHAVLNGDNK